MDSSNIPMCQAVPLIPGYAKKSFDTAPLQINIKASNAIVSPSSTANLIKQGYSRGLVQSLGENKQAIQLRIWIVDNSGSMKTNDGNKICLGKGNGVSIVAGCSRWTEMQQTVEYHARLAALIQAPTTFRMLNDPGHVDRPQQFGIAQNSVEQIDQDLAVAINTITNTSAAGVTPLTRHIREIREQIVELAPQLRSTGSKVAIVVATDGLPSNESGDSNSQTRYDFEQALRSLEGLPIWIVVRLCTDEKDVVDYWNEVDSNLEFNIEVLDDFVSEAKEIYGHNRWLNYGLPLHRIREMGFHDSLLDLLDETKLSKEELRKFCKLLFGAGYMDEAPDPDIDWNGFCRVLMQANNAEQKQWNPIRKRMEPWINMNVLQREYGRRWFRC